MWKTPNGGQAGIIGEMLNDEFEIVARRIDVIWYEISNLHRKKAKFNNFIVHIGNKK